MSLNPNSPKLTSWVNISPDTDFPIQNLPYGIFSIDGHPPRAGIAIGDYVLDLSKLQDSGLISIPGLPWGVFAKSTLNSFIGLGKEITNPVRERISELLQTECEELKNRVELRHECLIRRDEVTLHLPLQIGDYTDFYSSEQHAYNVGCMFRDPDNALLPNWKHLPVGYHGRASSIVVSGTEINRPKGQQKPNDQDPPIFGPTRLLDFELEMAFVIGKGTELGESISTTQAEDHIFGLCLFNDWSARDLQKWEYVPLGPFLAKNFASSVSPWIVTLEALEPFRIAGSKQIPKVLPYLEYSGNKNFNIDLEVYIKPEDSEGIKVSHSNFKYMYWNMNQQLAHHTVNGCDVNPGDVMASGTISGPREDQYGSMLELSWRGTKPISMPDGSERKFINDGDTVIMKGYGRKNGVKIGFGEVVSKILPAKS